MYAYVPIPKLQKSMAPVLERFVRMKLKGHATRVAPAASQVDIVDNVEPVHCDFSTASSQAFLR